MHSPGIWFRKLPQSWSVWISSNRVVSNTYLDTNNIRYIFLSPLKIPNKTSLRLTFPDQTFGKRFSDNLIIFFTLIINSSPYIFFYLSSLWIISVFLNSSNKYCLGPVMIFFFGVLSRSHCNFLFWCFFILISDFNSIFDFHINRFYIWNSWYIVSFFFSFVSKFWFDDIDDKQCHKSHRKKWSSSCILFSIICLTSLIFKCFPQLS